MGGDVIIPSPEDPHVLMSACAAKFVESWVQLLVPPARSKQLGGQLLKVSANGMA